MRQVCACRIDRTGARRRRAWIAAGLPLAGILLLLGCAPTRVPLPVVPPEDLPVRWLEEMAGEPCPGPFHARLRIRAEIPEQPDATLEGRLEAIPPDTLRLTARLGAFRPAFVLLANADSCELLVHETARYSVAPRTAPEWETMNPAAWAEALVWALCPRELFRRLRPDGPGRVDSGVWTVAGAIARSPWKVKVALDARTRSLQALDLSQGGPTLARVACGRYSSAAGSWLPGRLEVSRPSDRLSLRIERLSAGSLGPGEAPAVGILRPRGWTREPAAVPALEPGRDP